MFFTTLNSSEGGFKQNQHLTESAKKRC